jgi:hypothetical protein
MQCGLWPPPGTSSSEGAQEQARRAAELAARRAATADALREARHHVTGLQERIGTDADAVASPRPVELDEFRPNGPLTRATSTARSVASCSAAAFHPVSCPWGVRASQIDRAMRKAQIFDRARLVVAGMRAGVLDRP